MACSNRIAAILPWPGSATWSIDGAPLSLANALETVDVCIVESKRNAAGIAKFLKRY